MYISPYFAPHWHAKSSALQPFATAASLVQLAAQDGRLRKSSLGLLPVVAELVTTDVKLVVVSVGLSDTVTKAVERVLWLGPGSEAHVFHRSR